MHSTNKQHIRIQQFSVLNPQLNRINLNPNTLFPIQTDHNPSATPPNTHHHKQKGEPSPGRSRRLPKADGRRRLDWQTGLSNGRGKNETWTVGLFNSKGPRPRFGSSIQGFRLVEVHVAGGGSEVVLEDLMDRKRVCVVLIGDGFLVGLMFVLLGFVFENYRCSDRLLSHQVDVFIMVFNRIAVFFCIFICECVTIDIFNRQ